MKHGNNWTLYIIIFSIMGVIIWWNAASKGTVAESMVNLDEIKDIPKNDDKNIPAGYYKVSVMKNQNQSNKMAPIPPGCKLKPDQNGVGQARLGIILENPTGKETYEEIQEKCPNTINLTPTDDKGKKNKIKDLAYDANNIAEMESISTNKELPPDVIEFKQTKFSPTKILLSPQQVEDLVLMHPNPVYYQPGSFKFDNVSYVPNYEDSIRLSRSMPKLLSSTVPQNQFLDICSTHKNDKQGLEDKCKNLDAKQCNETDCCVLFGGAKCIAGNDKGPLLKENYADILIKNRDYYYYKDKCYGNCP